MAKGKKAKKAAMKKAGLPSQSNVKTIAKAVVAAVIPAVRSIPKAKKQVARPMVRTMIPSQLPAMYSVPKQVRDKFGIRKEHFQDLLGNTNNAPAVSTYFVNAGNRSLFPVFSRTADTYNGCRLQRLWMSYETNMFQFAGSSAPAGFVMAVMNFDASQPPFVTTDQFFNHSGERGRVPYEDFVFEIPHKTKDQDGLDVMRKYPINSSYNQGVPAFVQSPNNADYLNYNVGTLQIATFGNPVNTVIGRLFIVHQWELVEAEDPEATLESSYAHYQCVPTTAVAFPSLTLVGQPGNLTTVATGNTITVTVGTVSQDHVLQVSQVVTGGGGTGYAATPGPTPGPLTAAANIFANGSASVVSGSGSTAYTCSAAVQPLPGADGKTYTLIFTSPTVTGSMNTDLFLSYVPRVSALPLSETFTNAQLRSQLIELARRIDISEDTCLRTPPRIEEVKSDDETVVVPVNPCEVCNTYSGSTKLHCQAHGQRA